MKKVKTASRNFGIRKMLLIMRITLFIMMVGLMQVSASVYSQATKLNLNLENASFKEILEEIKEQSEFNFLYRSDIFDEMAPLSLDFKDMTLEAVLDKVLIPEGYSYEIEDNVVVIRKVPEEILNKVAEPALAPPPVSGKVTDEKGSSLPGATVVIKGTTGGTVTDVDGNFSLEAEKGDVLVFSFVGFKTQEVELGNQKILNIVLQQVISELDEVQIIGYGTTTRRLNTGSISSVKSEDFEARPVTNVIQALQGQVTGVSVTNNAAAIGSPPLLIVRGINSITSGNNPLIIIDGVIINENSGSLIANQLVGGGSGGGTNMYSGGGVSVMNAVNPNDIESIDILKDADATSIYGSRGTNGVILITTKHASLGKTKVIVNASTGWKRPVGITKQLNTEQYLQMRKDALAIGNMTATSVINPITPNNQNAPDLMLWSQTAYTDYSEFELGNPAPNYNFDASISGGTKAVNFVASGGYLKMYDTYMFKPYMERLTGRTQINHTSQNNKLNLRLASTYSVEKQSFSVGSFSSTIGGTNRNPPNFELYNPDGTFNYASDKGYVAGIYYNPLPNQFTENTSKTYNVLLTGELSYEIIKGLVAKAQINYGSQNNEFHAIYPSTAVNVQNQFAPVPTGSHTFNKFTSLNIEPQLTYLKKISGATIRALIGATYLDKTITNSAILVTNPGSDDLLWSYSSGKPTSATSNKLVERFESGFGRLNVDWEEKYIANLSFRRDGSSRFGPNNKFANFGSAGLAWIFTSEQFMEGSGAILNYGKLRGSYGTTGNNNISNYLYLGLLNAPTSTFSGHYIGNPGLNPANYPNPDIQWESTAKTDIGLELGFFKSRILLTATWYRSVSSSLLLSQSLPSQTGFSFYTGNLPGEVQNTGQEFELTTRNLGEDSQVQWTTKFNITHNANILKSFPGIENTSYASRYEVGRALPSPYSSATMEFPYQFTGIDPANGQPQFKDLNGDGRITTADFFNNAAWIGSAIPTIWGGLNNSISYKGFTLDVLVNFSNGTFTKWNYSAVPIGSIVNQSTDVIGNYWTKPGDVTKYPRPYTGVAGVAEYTNPVNSLYRTSSANLYRGYYIRLKNVQLAYELPSTWASKIGCALASLYVSGENLAVYTPVKLFKDPEVTNAGNAGLLMTITTGIKLEF